MEPTEEQGGAITPQTVPELQRLTELLRTLIESPGKQVRGW